MSLIYDHIVESIYRARNAPVSLTGGEKPLSIQDPKQDMKEMRINFTTFRLFLSEMATWARDEYIVMNGLQERIERRVPDEKFARLIFSYWDRDHSNSLSLQNIVTGLDEIMFLDGDLAGTTEWLSLIHI